MYLFLSHLIESVAFSWLMLVFISIAIAFAEDKKKIAWLWYFIGVVLQLLLILFSNQNDISAVFDWVIFFILFISSAVWIRVRYNKSKSSINESENKEENCTEN